MAISRHILAFAIALGSLSVVAGCGEEPSSPTGPAAEGEAATVAASALSFLQVSAGIAHTCGVATDGRAWCWGNAGWGQLGTGDTGNEQCNDFSCSTRPVAVAGGLRFRHVSAGGDFTCGVTTDDRVYCWGDNLAGQLGAGSSSQSSTTPVAIAGNRRYRQVRTGGNSACAISMAREAFCWGGNYRGQLGNGTTNSSAVPVRVGGGKVEWAQLTIGFDDTCGIAIDGRAFCWGSNNSGQLGDGTMTDRLLPVPVAGDVRFSQIDVTYMHSCAVNTAGTAYCWGSGIGLGNGSNTEQQLSPRPVVGNRKYDNVTTGVDRSCGVTRAGLGFCWGQNGGTLGIAGTASAIVPTRLAGDVHFIAISAGGASYGCGVATDRRAWCWGQNLFGNLGDGSTATRSVPTPVAAP